MDIINTYDVMVVGAGPGGLATAISAARSGARVLVVDRRPGTSSLPRATHVSTRSMEILRCWGLARAVRAGGVRALPASATSRTLADAEYTVTPLGLPPFAEMRRRSPVWPSFTPQDHLEPLLAGHLRKLGGELAFDTDITHLAVDGAGVRVRLGGSRVVKARYLVGADGAHSTVRRLLGIGVETLGDLGEWVQALVRADLSEVLGKRRYALYVVEHPEAEGILVPTGAGRWAYAQQWYPERGEHPADWTPRRIVERFRLAAGAPDLPVEVLGMLPFTMVGAVADSFRAGPGFLVGDAAHRMTPIGGMGLNTAMHDGHNLGWKLAWAARGWAGEALLDSYEQERRAIGLRYTLRSLRRLEPPADPQAEELDGRVPHAWVQHQGRALSTLDLFDGRLTVLAGRRGRDWTRVAARLAATGLPIAVHTLGGDLGDPDGEFAERYALRPTEAVLVRPDGHLAWRGTQARALPAAVAAALGHTDEPIELAG
jgi:2-polyprenyl-6-methoxyphenol hydroxylase-like FAD-dependent oxidoreductase